jgi:hypothetical protein
MVLLKQKDTAGNTEYRWIDEHSSEQSPWMNLDDALLWIIRRDQEKN